MPIVTPSQLDEVVARLKSGGVVAIPTDTVYGLAALPLRPDAVRALSHLKGRDEEQPIALLFDSAAALAPLLAEPRALDPVVRLWPGALTAIVRAREGSGLLPPLVSADGTVGVRKPDDQIARMVIRGCGGMLAVTSANRHGEPAATSAAEIVATFGNELLVLDGGPRIGRQASTVLDLSTDSPRILRPGPVTLEDLGLRE